MCLDEVLSRYAFAMLGDYLTPELVAAAKEKLGVTDAPVDAERIDMSAGMGVKRKATDEDELLLMQDEKKKVCQFNFNPTHTLLWMAAGHFQPITVEFSVRELVGFRP